MREPRDNTIAVIVLCVVITLVFGLGVLLATAPAY